MTVSVVAQRVLALTRLRAARLAGWMEHLWQSAQTSPDQGLAIGPGEVARLLDAEATQKRQEAFHAAMDDAAVAAAEAALAAEPVWGAITQVFGLTAEEADLLALAIAVELDPGLGRVVAYLHDDIRQTQSTAWLAARLAGREPAPLSGAALTRWQLALPQETPPRIATSWQADPALVLSVHSGVWQEPTIVDGLSAMTAARVSALPCLHEAARATLIAVPDLRDTELVGPPGIGRQVLAAQAAAAEGRDLLAADLRALLAMGIAGPQAIVHVLRQAAITGMLAYFRDADAADEVAWSRARQLGVPYLRGVRHASGLAHPVMLQPLSTAARIQLWRHVADTDPPPGLLAHRLSPAEIVRAAALPDPTAALKPHGRRPDSSLLTQLPCPYDWDDLVLPIDVQTQLRAFENQVRLRWTVYEHWGFGRLTHLGHGISALFGGPSGTGKTMAAQVLARSLGLDLLRVDLAGVVNKYIGETEKKLREVFDACEDSGAILFFDEADALFGSRTQVKDAHDRFANIEIDYLLQRIERFDGVAILATNRRQDLDTAFVRRLRFVIEFLTPRPDERLALWQRALLPESPSGEAILDVIDWDFLSHRLNMTGAEIKGTALGAAFMARAEGSRIGMRHVLAAAQREMAKQGVRLVTPLQEASR